MNIVIINEDMCMGPLQDLSSTPNYLENVILKKYDEEYYVLLTNILDYIFHGDSYELSIVNKGDISYLILHARILRSGMVNKLAELFPSMNIQPEGNHLKIILTSWKRS